MMSTNYAMLGRFYEVLFGMKSPKVSRPESAVTVGDGYVGLNINPRRPGRPGGLDHFGVEVEDIHKVLDRMDRNFPKIKTLRRPSNRPFAGITTHDPDGNIFDLSHVDKNNKKDIYTQGEWHQDRYISHFAIRTLNPEKCAEFYCDILDLKLVNRHGNDDNFYITDGRMNIVLAQWDITNYANTGIARSGPDHFAFKVENLNDFKVSYSSMIERNQTLAPPGVGIGPEGKARLEMLKQSAPYAKHFLSDIDNVLIAISD